MSNIAQILYYDPDLYPPTLNATAIFSTFTNVVIVCRKWPGPSRYTYPENVRVVRTSTYDNSGTSRTRGILDFLQFVLSVRREVKVHGCSVIYAYDLHGFVAAYFAVRTLRNRHLVYHSHDLTELKSCTGLRRLLKLVELRNARHADLVVFPEATRASLFKEQARLSHDPLIVANAPLKLERVPENRLAAVLAAAGCAAQTPVIIYQGAIGPGHALLQTIESMSQWIGDAHFVLLGSVSDGYKNAIITAANAAGVRWRVHLLGRIPYSELLSYTVGATMGLVLYEPSDVNATNFSTASNKTFEYLSVGVPVVGSDVPGFVALCKTNLWARHASPFEPRAIAATINSWLSSPTELAAAKRAARQAHLERFNYQTQFSKVITTIRNVIEQPKFDISDT